MARGIPPEGREWKAGQSGNPNGRPKGTKNRSTLLKAWLSVKTTVKNPLTGIDQKGTLEDHIVLAILKKARSGDVAAFREIMDTVYGKIQEQLLVEQKTITVTPINSKKGR